jgi:hypothetical protein
VNDLRQGEARLTTGECKSERLTARRGPADYKRVKEGMTHGKARPNRRRGMNCWKTQGPTNKPQRA